MIIRYFRLFALVLIVLVSDHNALASRSATGSQGTTENSPGTVPSSPLATRAIRVIGPLDTRSSPLTTKIVGPELYFKNKLIEVNFSLRLDNGQMQLIKMGVPKEYVFYVDLFREWDIWPDEFITGYKIVRRITADSVKGEFHVSAENEKAVVKKRFMSFESMMKWALTVQGLRFSLKGLSKSGKFFIRVKAESIKQKPPEMLRYFFFFMDQKDLDLKSDSPLFRPVRRK